MDTNRINWDLALGRVAPRPTLEQLRAESEALGAADPDTLWDLTEDGQWVPSATAEATTGLAEYRNRRLNYNG